jgi:hypothetical protein
MKPVHLLIGAAFAVWGSSTATAQSDRRAIEYYEANFEKYEGKQISVDVASSTREDTGEYGDVAVFRVYTKGKIETGFTYAVVPRSEVERFSKRYAEKEDFGTTNLRGVLTKGLYKFYISVDGAVLPDKSTD